MREEELYEIVRGFLEHVKGCEKVVVNRVVFREIKRWIIDVVGVRDHEIYCVEVKKNFSFDSVFAALKQSEFMCTACTHVYVCFPKDEYNKADSDLRNYLLSVCNDIGVGVLLVEEGRVEEIKEPVVEKVKNRIDFRNYYSVLTQLTGKLNKKEKVRLVKALGLLGLNRWLKKDLEKLEDYERRFGRKAGQFLAFEALKYTLVLPIRSRPAREAAERALDLIVEEAAKRNLGPFELIATNDISGFLSEVDERFIQVMEGLVELLKPYKGNLMELYRDKGPNGVYEELKKIKGVGSKTASLIMLELERRFKLGLPSNLELTDEMIEGLRKMGLDLEDFDREYIPLIDVYGWFLRGGYHRRETEEILEEMYKKCEEAALELRRRLKESFS
ncbi:MAG: hypothetical protein DRN04_11960 [Thermoprotei archaeon]|nr:MAG: hypothetical protein DRN04_11960 [Thermoprotei archaeon]